MCLKKSDWEVSGGKTWENVYTAGGEDRRGVDELSDMRTAVEEIGSRYGFVCGVSSSSPI